MSVIRNDNHNYWTGALIHIAVMSRPYIYYSIMNLSGENASPAIKYIQVLEHLICYIYPRPHLPLMNISNKHTSPSLSGYSVKGHTEILDPQKYPGLEVYTDADLTRDLSSRRSVSSHVQEYNSTATGWGLHKTCSSQLYKYCSNSSNI